MAARNIDAYVRGEAYARSPVPALAGFDRLNTWYYAEADKSRQPALDLARRHRHGSGNDMKTLFWLALLTGALILAPLGPARADQIDGDWCFKDGRHMTIEGPKIRMPGGKRMTGIYDRHAFSYVVPEGEPGAGGVTEMYQINDEMIRLKPATAAAEPPLRTRRKHWPEVQALPSLGAPV